jgi:hypothetical protein
MRTEGGSPNLINGVSRQPPEVRLTSQLEESLNQLPTISRGLCPRNPAMYMGTVAGGFPENAAIHLIDRDPTEQYVASISPDGVRVFDLAGNEKVVNTPDGLGYLAGAAGEQIKALTVQDYTFVLNTQKAVAKKPDLSPVLASEGLIHVVQGDYFTDYKIYVNGVVRAEMQSEGGPYDSSSDTREAERGVRTASIAYMLAYGTPPPGVTMRPASTLNYLALTFTAPEWQIAVLDNVIHIKNLYGNPFTLDGDGGTETRLRVHKGTSVAFKELPRKAPDGFRLKIAGDDSTGYDDYYVKFVQDAASSQGTWEETLAPAIQYALDPSTMPHAIVREADGTFTFKQLTWDERKVGDDDTNPWASFVGEKVTGVTFSRGRLGLHHGETLAQSRNGEPFSFWISSVLTPLDTDPVDAAISYPEVSTIYHVVPFAGETILFTSSVPFKITRSETLTQKNIGYTHLIENKVSPRARPVAAGSRMFFVSDADSGCFVHEFSYDRTLDDLAAQSVTEHVPGYIPSGVHMLEADDDMRTLVAVSEAEPDAIYVYRWLWIGTEKVQSAWQKWSVGAPILGLKFFDERLFLVTQRGDDVEFVSINCHEAWKDNALWPAYLDRQVKPAGVYRPATDDTLYVLPYEVGAGFSGMVMDDAAFGQAAEIDTSVGNQVTLLGDTSSKRIAFGYEFESYGVLSPLLHRSKNSNGGFGNAVPGFTNTVASVRFGLTSTAYLKVDVRRNYRKSYSKVLSAAKTGTAMGLLGRLIVGSPAENVSVMASAKDVKITFGNSGPYPYGVMALAWSGDARVVGF